MERAKDERFDWEIGEEKNDYKFILFNIMYFIHHLFPCCTLFCFSYYQLLFQQVY